MGLMEWLSRERATTPRGEPTEAQLSRAVERECEALQRFGLPVPEVRHALRVSPVGIRLPIYELPRHLFFPVSARAGEYMGFTLLPGCPDEFWRAQSTFGFGGLHKVIERFAGIWLNRDPYGLFRRLNWLGEFGGDFGTHENMSRWLAIAPLRPVQALTVEEVYDRITWRSRCFGALFDSRSFPLPVDNDAIPNARCRDALDLAATIPPKARPRRRIFGARPVVFDVVPPPDVRRFAEQFLKGLHGIKGLFAVETVAGAGAGGMRLICDDEHGASVERLATTFGGAVRHFQASDVAELPHVIYRVEGHPQSPFGSFDTMATPGAGSGESLLASLVNLTPAERCCVQVVFAPLPVDFWRLLHEELMCVGSLDEGVLGRLDELSSKFPAWQMAVRLFGTRPEIVRRLCDLWLRQYGHGARMWRFSEAELGPFDRKLEAWEVVETAELASMVQFLTR